MIGFDFTFTDVVKEFRNRMNDSDSIKDFCIDNFGKELSLAVGHDQTEEWAGDKAPFIVIVPTSTVSGLAEKEPKFNIEFDLGIVTNDTDPDDFEDVDNVGTEDMPGFYLMDQLVELMNVEFLNMAKLFNFKADYINVEYDSSTFLPLHVATVSVECEVDAVLGTTIGIS